MTPPYISQNKTLCTLLNKYVMVVNSEDELDFVESLIYD